jgi:excisionase family DNA binding protein
VSDLADLVVAELERNPTALDRLRELVREKPPHAETVANAAYTPATLAAELGRTPRSILDAIHRGELHAVKRGRGYLIGAQAVADWTRPDSPTHPSARNRRRRRPGRGEATTRAAWGLD